MDKLLHQTHSSKNSVWYGDWRINGVSYLLKIKDLTYLLTDDNKKSVNHDDIGWKGNNLGKNQIGENCICCNGERFRMCDTKYPPIIVKNMPNPTNCQYRMIDGKHRMQKRFLSGLTESEFYVLDYTDVEDKLILSHNEEFI